jgi:hypothetical protein
VRDGRNGESRLADLERELGRLPEVSAVRVVGDAFGVPLEVHVVATPAKHAKQIVRDIQAVALATFGIGVDRRVVSVVQLEVEDQLIGPPGNEPAAPLLPPAPPELLAVTTSVSGVRVLVEARIARDDEAQVSGFAEGSVASIARARLVAAATLDALHQFDATTQCLDVEHARVVRIGDDDAAVVALSRVEAIGLSERMVAGAAVIALDDPDGRNRAIAHAVIDAVWRHRSDGPTA